MAKKNYKVVERIKTTSGALCGNAKKPTYLMGTGSFRIRWTRTGSFKAKGSNHVVETGFIEILHVGLDEEYKEQKVVEKVKVVQGEQKTLPSNNKNVIDQTTFEEKEEEI